MVRQRSAKPRFPSSNLGGTSSKESLKPLYINGFGVFLFFVSTLFYFFVGIKIYQTFTKLCCFLAIFCPFFEFLRHLYGLCTDFVRTFTDFSDCSGSLFLLLFKFLFLLILSETNFAFIFCSITMRKRFRGPWCHPFHKQKKPYLSTVSEISALV